MDWRRLLAYITGRVDQDLLLRNEYLAAENRILRAKIQDQGPAALQDRLQNDGGSETIPQREE